MTDKILDWCRREALFLPGEHVVCAVSGGADSVALLHCLLALREPLRITVSAAHYNHCLRGKASQEDEAFVRRLCASWDVSLAAEQGDVMGHAAQTGKSIEEAARHLRYDFLFRQPGVIAVAHHADDQTETVLLNLLRGTGLKGLCAMAPRQDRLVRPLLSVTRQEIETYLLEHNLEHREDATNREDDALRNRLRHHVLPLLQAENPSLSQTVGRMTSLLREEEAYLSAQTAELLEKACLDGGWSCKVLAAAPGVLRRRAIRQLLTIPKPAMHHVDAVETLLQDLSGSAEVQLSHGWIARREYDRLTLTQLQEQPEWEPFSMQVGQKRPIPGTDLMVSLDGPIILENSTDSLSTFSWKYDMMDTNLTITVRPRRTGDTLRLSGGTKTVKRLMIDRKIPAAQRSLIPVITAEKQILAVYGLGTDVRWAARLGDWAWIVKIWHRGEKKP